MSDDVKNVEGYTDWTAYKAIKKADGAEAKAYHTYKALVSVARLAGFILHGDILLEDRTGKIHHTDEVVRRRLEYERELDRKIEQDAQAESGQH